MAIRSRRWKEDKVLKYLEALRRADQTWIGELFSPDAVVQSPLYGTTEAQTFYRDLFSDTSNSAIELIDIYESVRDFRCVAARFRYHWTLKGGEQIRFDCVDVFRFDTETRKITKLTIIYDTCEARAAWETMRGDGGVNALPATGRQDVTRAFQPGDDGARRSAGALGITPFDSAARDQQHQQPPAQQNRRKLMWRRFSRLA